MMAKVKLRMASLSFQVDVQGPDESGCIYVVTVMLVGGEQAANVSAFGLDWNGLVRSRSTVGEHFILTCWCGVPECARVDRGIEVRQQGGMIEWKSSYPMKQERLSFDAIAYGEAIDELLELEQERWPAAPVELQNVELSPYGCEAFSRKLS